MEIARAAWLGLLTAALLAGCGRKGEERITQAFPLSPEVSSAKSKFDAAAVLAHADLYQLRRDYEAQVAQRALDCRQDYWPGMFDEVADIRLHIVNDACFRDADARLITWLATHRMGWLAAQAPMHMDFQFKHPLAASTPITHAIFADVAGVVLLQTDEGYTLSDLDGQVIRSAKASFGHQYSLSANGRLLADGKGSQATIYDAETGEALASIYDLRSPKVHFVGDQGLVFQRSNGVILYRDFPTQQQAYVGLDASAVIAVFAKEDHRGFAVIGNERMATLRLEREGDKLRVTVDRRTPVLASLGENAAPQPAHGGVVFRGNRNQILRLKLRDTFNVTVAIVPHGISRVLPTTSANKYLLTSIGSGGANYFLLDLFEQTIAPIDAATMPSKNLLWAPPAVRNARIDGTQLEWVDALPKPGRAQSIARALTNFIMRRPSDGATEEVAATAPVMEFPRIDVAAPPRVPVAPTAMPKFSPGMDGIAEAMDLGVLRPGSLSDLNAWKSFHGWRSRHQPNPSFFTYALGPKLFVITGPMTIPANSNGFIFILAPGAPYPGGELGSATLLDANNGRCAGRCSAVFN